MKTFLPLLCLALLSGCVTHPPTDADSRQRERQQSLADREDAIEARAQSLQREGLSEREARAVAESQFLGRGPRNP